MSHLGRPHGITIIGCRCTSPMPWPILVLPRGGTDDPETIMEWKYKWYLKDMVGGDSTRGIRGRCPQCKRPFHAVFFEGRGVFADVVDAMYLMVAWEDIPADERPALRAGVKSASFMWGMEEDRTPCIGSPMIEVMTSGMVVLSASKQQRSLRPHRQDLPSRWGFSILIVDSDVKKQFVYDVRQVMRETGMDPRDLVIWNEFPDWKSGAPDEDFRQWREELSAFRLAFFERKAAQGDTYSMQEVVRIRRRNFYHAVRMEAFYGKGDGGSNP